MTHGLDRTGAPRALRDLVRWLVSEGGVTGCVISPTDGPMLDDFGALLPTLVAPTRDRLASRIARRFAPLQRWQTALSWLGPAARQHGPFDLIYSNTCTNGAWLKWLEPLRRPVVTHAHEMDFWMDHQLGSGQFALTADRTDHWIAVSRAVAAALERRGVASDRVSLVYEVTDEHVVHPTPEHRESVRLELGIPAGAFLAVGAGTTDWRKGADLVPQLALLTRREAGTPPIYFAWIGGNGLSLEQLRHEVRLLGLEDRVRLLGERPDAAPYLAAADLAVVPSREDPYPLVMLEAGAAGVPILCFSGSGGPEEFARAGGGACVPFLDVPAMAEAVARLQANSQELAKMGEAARAIVEARSRADVVGRQVLAIVETVASSPRRT